jgi:acylpyruvate hydrolase
MRLFAYLDEDESPALGVLAGDRVIPLAAWDLVAHLDQEDGLAELRRQIPALEGARGLAVADITPAPAVEPGKIICIGLNYRDHVEEQHRTLPSRPMLFAKFPNTLVGHGAPIIRPEGTRALDLEVELGIVIGRRARRVARQDAMDHVAGYVVVNDISARDWQGNQSALPPGEKGDGQWLRAKGSDTFLPMGPVFVSTDEIEDPGALRLRSWRIPGSGPDRGQAILMQDATAADMIFDIPDLIEFVTRAITLEPGDVIATGTPGGVGVYRDPPVFLEPGDRVRCEVEGIGMVENPVVDWNEAPGDD